MSIGLSVHLKLKILVTTKLIGLSLSNIAYDPLIFGFPTKPWAKNSLKKILPPCNQFFFTIVVLKKASH